MKNTLKLGICALLSTIAGICQAQQTTTPTAPNYTVVNRAANSRTWRGEVDEVLPSGQTIPHILKYEEWGSGICYMAENGQWKDSSDVISDAGEATNGLVQVFFPNDLGTSAVRLITPAPESLVLDGAPGSISYWDGNTSVVIATLTNSVGELISSNDVLYPCALVGPGVKCDVLYKYRMSGLEQDIIFRTQPPDPGSLGLNSDNVKVQVTSVFLNPPVPGQTAGAVDPQSGLSDTALCFGGGMKMIQGRAFLTGNSTDAQIPTFKSWEPIDSSSSALIEQVPYSQIKASLATLPVAVATPGSPFPHGRRFASLRAPTVRKGHAASAFRNRNKVPALRPLQNGTNVVKMSRVNMGREQGFCLDYITVSGDMTNVVFTGDSTFYVSAPLYLYGTTLIEGGSVIKANSSGVINIEPSGTVVCQTSPYLPALFTSVNDSVIGDWWGTGSPALGDVSTFLNFQSTNVVLHDLHFAYATKAVTQTTPGPTASINLWDCEFVDVGAAIDAYNIGLYNVLIGRTAYTNAVILEGTNFLGENVTADYGSAFIKANNPAAIIALTNCLIASQPLLATGSSATFQTNAVACVPTVSTTVYQVTGAGNYYLTNGSTYATAGTPNIAPDLLADLQQKTVWPPTVYADTNISLLGTLGPDVARDTNSSPAIGFHYPPLDVVFGGDELTNSLTITAGTAVGWFEETGPVNVSGQAYAVTLNNGANLSFNGTATQPCYCSQYAMVQERGNNNWNNYSSYMGSFTFDGSSASHEPLLSGNFTKFTLQDDREFFRDAPALGSAGFKNCEFYNVGASTYDMQYLTFTNCLFFRDMTFTYNSSPLNFTNENCTYYNGGLALARVTGQNSYWSIENTIFDGTLLAFYDDYNGSTNDTFFEYNAFNTNNLGWETYGFPYSNWALTNTLEDFGPSDQLTTNYGWESIAFGLGDFYLPTNSPLIKMGSTNANLLGLYHFTTQTNQTPEGTNIVTIGYHYVATTTNGLPLDSNGDGIPDYLEDANGDGLVDNGETNWALAILTQPVSQVAVPGTSPNFYLGADGVAPLSYQWYFNGTNLNWATNSTLTLTNIQSTNEGLYFAVVTNFSGSLTSAVVALEPSGLVGWWPGESNALDYAGPNNGQLTNGITFSNGIIGQDFQFDGTNGYILVPDSPILKPANLTIETWVRFSSLTSQELNARTDLEVIAEKPDINPPGSESYNDGYILYKRQEDSGTNDVFRFGVTSSDGTTEVYAQDLALGIQTNVWYFLAAVRGSNYIELYVNGQLADHESVGFDQSYGTAPLYFASLGEPAVSEGKLKGNLDEVALYNRSLSSNEIQAAYSVELAGIRNCFVPPVIVTQPSSQLATAGTTATLLVAAAGSPPLSYQWSFDGATIPGATNATLILPGVQGTNTGNYSVVVSNPQGTATSSNAFLTVETCFSAVDVALVIDDSGSMGEALPDGKIKLTAARIAATNFVQGLNFASDQAALFAFNNSVTNAQPLTNNFPDVLNAISMLTTSNGDTFMGNALQIAQEELAGPRHNSSALPVMILMSDGQPTDIDVGNDVVDTSNLVLGAATLVKAAGTRLFTVALGTDADTNFMRLMATTPGDSFYATNVSRLTNVYNLIAASICRGTPPSVQIISPINQYLLARTNATIIATNTAAGSGVPLSWVEFFDNGEPDGFALSTSNLYEVSWIPATNGTHILTALAMDTNGLESFSDPVTNFVRGLPSVTITNPVYGQLFQNPPTNIEIYATATASDDLGATVASVTFYMGTIDIGTRTIPPYTNFYTLTNSGTYTLSAEVIDSLGAVGISSNIVITNEPANQGPHVYAGPNQTNIWSPARVQLNGRVSDDGLPLGSVLNIAWVNLSGSTPMFDNSNLPVTGVTIAGPGTNVLQLSAWDGPITNYSYVTIVSLPTNPPPAVFPGTNQTIVLPAMSTNNLLVVSPVEINALTIPKPNGIDYYAPSNCVIASVYSDATVGGDPFNFELIDKNGVTNQFSSITDMVDEVYIAGVRDSIGGFGIGEMFTGNGSAGQIMRLRPDGTPIGDLPWTNSVGDIQTNLWVALPTLAAPGQPAVHPGLLRGGLWVDRTGVWGGDLIVSTLDAAETGDFNEFGYIWRVNSQGQAKLVATIDLGSGPADTFEGITTVPDDVQRYGPWAGRILVGGDFQGDLFAVDTNGIVVRFSFPFGAEDIRVIPPNENLFGCDQYNGLVFGVPAAQFSGMVGDILVATEASGIRSYLYRIRWNGTNFDTYTIYDNWGFQNNTSGSLYDIEGANFAPAGLPGLPAPGWVQLEGVVTDSVPTVDNWTVVSNTSGAQIEFSDASLTNTTVNFTAPGTNVLQLSASIGGQTVSSNVTIIVIQNRAPWVFAGTNVFTGTGQVDLEGLVTNIVLPPPYNTNHLLWTVASEPAGGAVTFGWTNETTNGTYIVVTNTVSLTGSTGKYVLELTADDGQATNSQEVAIYYSLDGNLALAPELAITASNELCTFTATLTDTNGSPIAGKEIDFSVLQNDPNGDEESLNYLSYSALDGNPPPATFTNFTAGDGSISFTYTNLAGLSGFESGVGADFVEVTSPAYPGLNAVATNYWVYNLDCGDQWLGQIFGNYANFLSIEPWADGNHEADYYVFQGVAGDAIRLGLWHLPDIDANPLLIFLRDPSGRVVSVSQPTQSGNYVDTVGQGLCFSMLDYTVPTTTNYVVEVTTASSAAPDSMPVSYYNYNLYLSCSFDTNATQMGILSDGTNVPDNGGVVFPATTQGVATNIELVITNSGSDPFTVTNVAVFGDFQLTNTILNATLLPGDSTNLFVRFNATANGFSFGSLVVSAGCPPGSNYVIYLAANTLLTNAGPAIQLVWPPNGGVFLAGSPITLTATTSAGSAPVGSVYSWQLVTNGIGDWSAQLFPLGNLFTWSYTLSSGSPWGYAADVTLTAIAQDVAGLSNSSPPVLIHVVPFYSLNPLQEPQIELLDNGTNVPGGGTIVFPRTTQGVATNVSLVITNAGNYPLGFTAVGLIGDFTTTNSLLGPAIPGGNSTNFNITFNASSSGASYGELILSNNASIGEVFAVGLEGGAYPATYVTPSTNLPVATNEQVTVLANSANNTIFPLYLDQPFDTNVLKIASVDTSQGTAGTVTIINNGTAINYTPPPGYRSEEIGGVLYPADGFYYTISDANGNTASGLIAIIIYATDGPDVTLGVTDTNPAPGEIETLTATITDTPSTNILGVAFYMNNQEIGFVAGTNAVGGTDYVLPNWPAIYDLQFDNEFVVAAATDIFGQVGVSQQIGLDFQRPTNGTPPVASLDEYEGQDGANGIQAFTNGIMMCDGVFNVYGQAYGSNVVWQLSLYSSDGNTLIRNLTPTNNTAVGSLTSTNFLALCDLSTVQNGPYQLVLTVTSDFIEQVASINFILDSNLKVGQFSFSQQDMVIPLNGIPLTVTRTYNSINPSKGDFGYGWTYSLDNLNVSLDETRENRMDLDGDVYSERMGGGRDVTLTLPNGQTTTFAYSIDQNGTGGDTYSYYPHWTAAPGINYGLVVMGNPYYETLNGCWNDVSGQSEANFDFLGFYLTNQDGTVYTLSRPDLGDHFMLVNNSSEDGMEVQAYGTPYLTQINTFSNLETITINPGSIVYSTNKVVIKQIAFQRNGDNLITAISDPNGLTSGIPSGPPALMYQYDNQDNLIAVEQLVDTNGSGTYVTNTFSYTNSAFPHFITGIINANGTQVAKNFYDDSGKLIAVQDANGNLTQFFNTVSNSMEVVVDANGGTNSYVYDSRGNVARETNAVGQVTTMGYDVNNNKTNEIMYLDGAPYSTNSYAYDTTLNVMLSSTDPLGNSTIYTYDNFGRLLTTTDPNHHSTTNTYDGAGNLVLTVDALGDTNQNIYAGNLLVASIDPIGTMTTNLYDSFENLITSASLDASGNLLSSNTYTYDANGNRLSSTVWRQVAGSWEGDTTSNQYDGMNRIIETFNPDGGTNATVYNATGQQQATVENGNMTSYGYDNENRLIATTNADGTVTGSGYDNNGNRITSTDEESRVTRYQYDALNRLTNTLYPDGAASVTVYDALGRVAQTIDARGTITANGYDVAGRKTAVTNAVGTSVVSTNRYTYDNDGNQIIFTDADNHSTTNVFDALNRQVEVEYQDGTTNETVYDPAGRSVAQINQDHVTNEFGYDGAGRLVLVTNAVGTAEQTVTQYQYDEAGNEIAQIDALGRTNLFAYDSMGRKTSHNLPSGNNESWTYDLNGNQIGHDDFNGRELTSAYDSMNRLTGRGGPLDQYFTYTPTGQKFGMVESSGNYSSITTNFYDSRDRLVQKTVSWRDPESSQLGANALLNYGYDANGNVTNIASGYANGVHLAYAYDPLNRLTNVLSHGAPAAAYSYDLAGNLVGMQYGNGVTNRYQYDSLNRLTNLVWNYHTSSLGSFEYRVMNGGTRTNLLESINGGSSVTYQWSFDHLYRLTNENISAIGSLAYGYDSVGNRINRSPGGSPMSSLIPSYNYSYDTNDELLTASGAHTVSSSYDSDGNTLGTVTPSVVTNTYTYYSGLDQIATAVINGNNISQIGYDTDGNRVFKDIHNSDGSIATLKYYLVDDVNPSGYPQVVEEYEGEWTVSVGWTTPVTLRRAYNYGTALISQQQFDPGTYLPSAISYYGYDGHGNVRFLTDANGTITDTYTYDAFGSLIASSIVTSNNYLYCGQQWDPDLGLYYNRARYLNTDSGRFWTRDGDFGNNEDPLSLHKYLYAEDEPVDLIDPLGHESYVGFEVVGFMNYGHVGIITHNPTTGMYTDLEHHQYVTLQQTNSVASKLFGYYDILFIIPSQYDAALDAARQKYKPTPGTAWLFNDCYTTVKWVFDTANVPYPEAYVDTPDSWLSAFWGANYGYVLRHRVAFDFIQRLYQPTIITIPGCMYIPFQTDVSMEDFDQL